MDVAGVSREAAERTFGLSIALAGLRCVLRYLFLPFGLPALGISLELAAPISLVVGVLAFFSIVWSVRRLWHMDYSWKWLYLLMGIVSTMVIIVFIAGDAATLIAALRASA
jgi:hypothetical protein